MGVAEKYARLVRAVGDRERALQLVHWRAVTEEMRCALARASLALANLAASTPELGVSPIEAIHCIDRAIVVAGPYAELGARLTALEDQHREKVERHNSSFSSFAICPAEPVAGPADTPSLTAVPSHLPLDDFVGGQGGPVRVKDAVNDWAALSRWTEADYFTHRFGHRLVPIEVGASYLYPEWTQTIMPLGSFVETFMSERADGVAYLAQHDLFAQIPELEADISVPLHAPSASHQVLKNIWMGAKGTRTPLHFDRYRNFFVQVVGYKQIYLVDPLHSHHLASEDPKANTSNVPLDSLPLEELPFPVLRVLLGPGDLLYIPPHWWHMVLGVTASISVSFWF